MPIVYQCTPDSLVNGRRLLQKDMSLAKAPEAGGLMERWSADSFNGGNVVLHCEQRGNGTNDFWSANIQGLCVPITRRGAG